MCACVWSTETSKAMLSGRGSMPHSLCIAGLFLRRCPEHYGMVMIMTGHNHQAPTFQM
jgi:hypothetical protein